MLTLKDKVSIITGASSGIGRGTAILFSNLESKLVLTGRDEKALDETIEACHPGLKNDIVKVVGDITENEVQKKIVDKAIEKFGKIDVLINGAAILQLSGLQTMNLDDYDYLMKVNVNAVIVLTQLCLPYLIQQKGSIVNISSICGTRSYKGSLAYCMSKAALDQFTKCIALELADKGVRVNSINPGVVPTNIQRRAGIPEEALEMFWEKCKITHPLGRAGTVDEVAKTIAFFASDNASFITGELVHVDGGRHAVNPEF